MKRILLIVGALVAVLVVGLVLFVFTGLGGAIKAIVEGVGSKATGTQVTLASADVSLTSGDGTLKGLVVGNPKGFKTPSAIELGQIHVKVDTSTVTSSTVVIKEVLIEGPRLTYEVGPGGSNIAVIQENLAALGGGTGGGGSKGTGGGKPSAEPKEKEPKSEGGGTKVIIDDLVVKGGHVAVSASFLGGKEVGAALPDIHLKDIGKSEGGVTSDVIAKRLLDALTKGALDAVAGLNLDGLKKAAGGAVDSAIKSATDILGGKKKK
jgi:hypothetical protein